MGQFYFTLQFVVGIFLSSFFLSNKVKVVNYLKKNIKMILKHVVVFLLCIIISFNGQTSSLWHFSFLCLLISKKRDLCLNFLLSTLFFISNIYHFSYLRWRTIWEYEIFFYRIKVKSRE